MEVFDKYTGKLICKLDPFEGDISQIIDSAKKAQKELMDQAISIRRKSLQSLANELEKNAEKFTNLIVKEAGKPISYARGEVERGIETLRLSSEATLRDCSEVYPVATDAAFSRTAYVQRFPLGIVAGITPFNFPLNLAIHKFGPAVAAGNALILKSSPFAPLTMMEFSKLVANSDLPKNILQVLNVTNEQMEQIIGSDDISMISFTGGTKVGKYLENQYPYKKVLLELGGNAACLIDETTEITEQLVDKIVKGSFLYSGQICISTQRILIHESNFEEFCQKAKEKTLELVCGDPSDEKTIVGPLIDESAFERVNTWVTSAINSGAKVICGAKIVDQNKKIYAPTLLENVSMSEKLWCEEVFGPVAIVEKFSSFEEGLDMINDSKFGLQAGVYTEKLDRAKLAFKKLNVGAVLINDIPGVRHDYMPYGGVKNSGRGREGVHYAVNEMSEPKLMIM